MAISHYSYNSNTQHGAILRSAMGQLEAGLEGSNDVLGVMITMIDGDGSLASQFNEVTSKFGFPDNTTAKAAYDEMNSLLAKLNGNGSVTNVNAALLQAFNRFR